MANALFPDRYRELDLLALDEALALLWAEFGHGSREAQDYYDYRMALVPDD